MYRLGTGLTAGQVYRQWDGCINGGMGVSMVGWVYQWWDGHIDGGMGILIVG